MLLYYFGDHFYRCQTCDTYFQCLYDKKYKMSNKKHFFSRNIITTTIVSAFSLFFWKNYKNCTRFFSIKSFIAIAKKIIGHRSFKCSHLKKLSSSCLKFIITLEGIRFLLTPVRNRIVNLITLRLICCFHNIYFCKCGWVFVTIEVH